MVSFRGSVDDYVIEDPKRQNILIALICAGAFIANLDATIVNITLPVLSQEFSVSPGTVSWTVLTYLLFEAGFMLPMGKLADMKGVRMVYLAGFAVFLLGSLACGVSSHIDELIAFRAFQGIGGAMLFTVMMSFIPIYLPPGRRIFATGLVTTAAAAGVGLGPPLGGWLASTVGWRWIFFVNIPFCLAAIIAGRRFIPAAFPRISDRRFDFAGAVFPFGVCVFSSGRQQRFGMGLDLAFHPGLFWRIGVGARPVYSARKNHRLSADPFQPFYRPHDFLRPALFERQPDDRRRRLVHLSVLSDGRTGP